jgi:hypothetical protein
MFQPQMLRGREIENIHRAVSTFHRARGQKHLGNAMDLGPFDSLQGQTAFTIDKSVA